MRFSSVRGISAAVILAGLPLAARAANYQVSTINNSLAPYFNAGDLIANGPELYFAGTTGTQQDVLGNTVVFQDTQLWKSDGTNAGTMQVSAGGQESELILPFVFQSGLQPDQITAYGGGVAFTGLDANANGSRSAWYSDGTALGTVKLSGDFSSSGPNYFTPAGGQLFFTADNASYLYVASQAAGSAHLVTSAMYSARSLAGIGNTLYLSGYTDADMAQLWTSDGTSGGTQQVKVLSSRVGGAIPNEFTQASGHIFFTAMEADDSTSLWTTDGTPDGTQRIFSATPPFTSPSYLTATTTRLFFSGNDPSGFPQLWTSQGDSANTTQLTTTLQGLELLTANGNDVYFLSRGMENQLQIWSSDGTIAGTQQLSEFDVGNDPNNPSIFLTHSINFDGRYAFTTLTQTDSQLWIYAPGDLTPQMVFQTSQSEVSDLTVAGGNLYFLADGQIQQVAVPEPAMLSLLGMAGLLLARRRQIGR